MPQSALKICRVCGKACRGNWCDKHKHTPALRAAEYDAKRAGARKGVYGSNWQRCRILALNESPLCPCGKPAMEVHHIDGNYFNNSPENLQPLCKSCHSKHTAKHQGWGRKR